MINNNIYLTTSKFNIFITPFFNYNSYYWTTSSFLIFISSNSIIPSESIINSGTLEYSYNIFISRFLMYF